MGGISPLVEAIPAPDRFPKDIESGYLRFCVRSRHLSNTVIPSAARNLLLQKESLLTFLLGDSSSLSLLRMTGIPAQVVQ